MKSVFIFRHEAYEGPGYLAEVLAARGIRLTLVRVDAGEPVPTDVSRCSGLVFMGGSMSVNDPLPWIESELRLIRAAQACDLPILGHCLGAQLISKALGGQVTRNPTQEVGWYEVESVATGKASAWLGRLPPRFDVFHWHGETCSLPAGALPLLKSERCKNQAFALGKTLALQCHVEMNVKMVHQWLEVYRDSIPREAPGVQSIAEMTRNLPQRVKLMRKVADQLYTHWINGLNPSTEG